MAKENENLENQPAAPAQSTTPNRDKWLANLRGKYGEDKSEEELYDLSMKGYDTEHEAAKKYAQETRDFADKINQYPELAGFYSEASQGNVGAAVLNLGDLIDAYRSGEIDDEGYKAKVAERKKADEDAAAAEADKQAKIAKFDNEVFVPWCEKNGYDPEEWMKKADEMLFKPMRAYEMAEAQLDAIDKMINYDAAVAAAETKGRNANIQEQRRSVPNTSAPAGGAGIGTNAATGGGDIFSEIANSEKRQRDKNRAQ